MHQRFPFNRFGARSVKPRLLFSSILRYARPFAVRDHAWYHRTGQLQGAASFQIQSNNYRPASISIRKIIKCKVAYIYYATIWPVSFCTYQFNTATSCLLILDRLRPPVPPISLPHTPTLLPSCLSWDVSEIPTLA